MSVLVENSIDSESIGLRKTNVAVPRIVLIVGMHRSGSSLLASLVNDLGFFSGNELLPANEHNPEGYWEYVPLMRFHDKILRDYGNVWYMIVQRMPIEELLEKYRHEALELVKKMDEHGKDWYWKDPRMAIFMEFWMNILKDRDISVIVSIRDPFNIVESISVRDNLTKERSLMLWEFTMFSILCSIMNHDKHLLIHYNALISKPNQEIGKIAAFLFPFISQPNLTELTLRASKKVRPNLKHHDSAEIKPLSPIQKELNNIFQGSVVSLIESPGIVGIAALSDDHRNQMKDLILNIFECIKYNDPDNIIEKKLLMDFLADERNKVATLNQAIDRLKDSLDKMNESLQNEIEKVKYLNAVINELNEQYASSLNEKKRNEINTGFNWCHSLSRIFDRFMLRKRNSA